MNWDDLRYVLAVSRAAGLNAAARDLKINPSSLYRRLQALERRMGVPLRAIAYGLSLDDRR